MKLVKPVYANYPHETSEDGKKRAEEECRQFKADWEGFVIVVVPKKQRLDYEQSLDAIFGSENFIAETPYEIELEGEVYHYNYSEENNRYLIYCTNKKEFTYRLQDVAPQTLEELEELGKTSQLYNLIKGKMRKDGINLEALYTDKDDLINEIYVNHVKLLKSYNPEKANLKTWLARTMPRAIKRSKRKEIKEVKLEDIEQLSDEEQSEPKTEWSLEFDRMYFLKYFQKKAAEEIYNQELTIKDAQEKLNLSEGSLRQYLRRAENNMIKMTQTFEFIMYGMLKYDAELEEFYYHTLPDKYKLNNEIIITMERLTEEQKEIIILLYGNGVTPEEACRDFTSKGKFYHQLEKAKEGLMEEFEEKGIIDEMKEFKKRLLQNR